MNPQSRTWMSVSPGDERLTSVWEVCAEHTCVGVLHLDLESRTLVLHIQGSSWLLSVSLVIF